ncbi:MAG: FHIPEP family type III secretion protein, partial [Lachnospiraceae bacterium]|nr:FHIPEP family type III secretion protein [Lachnospiraceae bacterium]
DVLTEYVRHGLRRAISSRYFMSVEGMKNSVVTLDPKIEQEIMQNVKQTEQGAYLSLDPERIRLIMESTRTEIGKLEEMGRNPIVVCSPIVRMYFKRMSDDYFEDLIVVSYNEIEPGVELESVGMITA